MFANRAYQKGGEPAHHDPTNEMKHADCLIERILFAAAILASEEEHIDRLNVRCELIRSAGLQKKRQLQLGWCLPGGRSAAANIAFVTYGTPAPQDPLDADAIAAALRAAHAPVSLAVVATCGSTNAELLVRAAAGAPSGTALACETQTAGRGRRGRAWIAPTGGSLAFSLLWRMPRAGAALAGLSLAAGVACIRALEHCGVHGVALKWPNDIVHGGSKLGGILVEAVPGADGSAIVCGVGVNTRLSGDAREAIGQPSTDVATLAAAPPSRTALLAALLVELAAAMERFAADGFAAFRDAWLARHAYQGETVRVVLADERCVDGRAVGLAEDGALLVEHAGRIERFHSGDVSLRPAA
jgi:BirA family biotin operon repressor/biotin-[acetyl-CoA-carboxylase] ligase